MAKSAFLNTKVKRGISDFLEALRKRNIRVNKAFLFGSYAKGNSREDSDIDIAVFSSQFGKDRTSEMMFLRRIALSIDSHIEPIPFSPSDLDEKYSTLIQEIRKHGILIKH